MHGPDPGSVVQPAGRELEVETESTCRNRAEPAGSGSKVRSQGAFQEVPGIMGELCSLPLLDKRNVVPVWLRLPFADHPMAGIVLKAFPSLPHLLPVITSSLSPGGW